MSVKVIYIKWILLLIIVALQSKAYCGREDSSRTLNGIEVSFGFVTKINSLKQQQIWLNAFTENTDYAQFKLFSNNYSVETKEIILIQAGVVNKFRIGKLPFIKRLEIRNHLAWHTLSQSVHKVTTGASVSGVSAGTEIGNWEFETQNFLIKNQVLFQSRSVGSFGFTLGAGMDAGILRLKSFGSINSGTMPASMPVLSEVAFAGIWNNALIAGCRINMSCDLNLHIELSKNYTYLQLKDIGSGQMFSYTAMNFIFRQKLDTDGVAVVNHRKDPFF